MVDFGRQRGLPGWFRSGLRAWLGKFHVAPRDMLAETLDATAHRFGCTAMQRPLFRGYAHYAVVIRPVKASA